MNAKNHIISIVLFGVLYYLTNGNLFLTLTAMFSAVAVDSDHVIDYILTQKRVDSLKEMMKAFDTFEVIKKNYLIFHSWEFIILFGFFLFFYPSRFLIAIFTGCAFHLLLDQLFNTRFLGKYNVKSFFYFFFYRMKHNFECYLYGLKVRVLGLEKKYINGFGGV